MAKKTEAKAVPAKQAAPEKKESRCPGCSRRTMGQHCAYPSNPIFNAQNPVKRDPLCESDECVTRRERAAKIKAGNRDRAFAGAMNGGNAKWWEGPPYKFNEKTGSPMASVKLSRVG